MKVSKQMGMTKEKRDELVKKAEEKLASGEMLYNKAKLKDGAALLDKVKYAACQKITKLCALSGIDTNKFAEIARISKKQALEIHCSHYDRVSLDQLTEIYEAIQKHLEENSSSVKSLINPIPKKIA